VRCEALDGVSANPQSSIIDLKKRDSLRQEETDGDIRGDAFNSGVARSRLERPTRSAEVVILVTDSGGLKADDCSNQMLAISPEGGHDSQTGEQD
jgi:hypothetical protein